MTHRTWMVWGHVDRDDIDKANVRLRAFYARHALELPDWRGYGRAPDAANEVTAMLLHLWEAREYGGDQYTPGLYENALRIFRRAIGSDRATGLHYDHAGYYQYSR